MARNPMKIPDEWKDQFESWWEREGKAIDPDTSGVPWFYKRKGLAAAAFASALAHSKNYIADDAIDPDLLALVMDRTQWVDVANVCRLVSAALQQQLDIPPMPAEGADDV